eukprot:COSAG04_NODE_9_length_43480_cov_106.113806_23_plen_183_part_00
MALDDGAAAEAAGPDDDGEAIPAEQQFDEATVRALLQGAFEREGTRIDGVAASLTGEVLRMFVLGARLGRTSPSPLPLPSPLRGRPRPTHPTPLLLCAKLLRGGQSGRTGPRRAPSARPRGATAGAGAGATERLPRSGQPWRSLPTTSPEICHRSACLGKMNEGRVSDAVLMLASQMLLDFS